MTDVNQYPVAELPAEALAPYNSQGKILLPEDLRHMEIDAVVLCLSVGIVQAIEALQNEEDAVRDQTAQEILETLVHKSLLIGMKEGIE